MFFPDSTLAQLEASEAFAIAVGLGLCVLVLFRMFSKNTTITQWATFDLIFVATQLTFFWLAPAATPAQLWSFAVVFAVILGSASLAFPVAQSPEPESETQNPTGTTKTATSVEKLTKAA